MKHTDFDLTNYNSYRIRSVARIALFPSSVEELVAYMEEYPDCIVLGGGNNIILSKPEYDTPFVFCSSNMSECRPEGGGRITVSCGLSMASLSAVAANEGFSGFEVFYDIPGCVGGGICMNAGAGVQLISDYIVSVEAFDMSLHKTRLFSKRECGFGYRNSLFKNNRRLVVTGATFVFEKTRPKEAVWERMHEAKRVRHEKQPRDLPSAGSVFKRPEGRFVGAMIQELGMKGCAVGGAAVSEKHAGFIVNLGGATGADVIALIGTIRQKVYETYGIWLETEQIVI